MKPESLARPRLPTPIIKMISLKYDARTGLLGRIAFGLEQVWMEASLWSLPLPGRLVATLWHYADQCPKAHVHGQGQ